MPSAAYVGRLSPKTKVVKRGKKKIMSGGGGNGSWEVRWSNGESVGEEVGEEVGGCTVWLRHETAEMSPTSDSCAPNYIKKGSRPTSSCHLPAFAARHFLLAVYPR